MENIKEGDIVIPVDGDVKPFSGGGWRPKPLEIKEYRVAKTFEMGLCSASFLNLVGVDGDFSRRYFKKSFYA